MFFEPINFNFFFFFRTFRVNCPYATSWIRKVGKSPLMLRRLLSIFFFFRFPRFIAIRRFCRPDISNLRSSAESRIGRSSFSNRGAGDGQQQAQQSQQTTAAIQDAEQNDSMRRQPSVAGEDIKIVIHDVDFDPNLMGKRKCVHT